MFHLLSSVFLTLLICTINLMYYCEGTSITLSPLGMVSVCSGGQALLTSEITSGSGFLYWTVSVPNLVTPQPNGRRIVADQGNFNPNILFNGLHATAFTVTRTSANPLTSQMMVNINVTTSTEINESTIYCSEDGNENGAPMVTINVINEDSFLNHLNLSLVNQFLGNGIRVTLQWLQKPGAVYWVSVLPATQVTNAMNNNSIMINLTISYNIQYELNVSISSSLCDVTTTRILKYVNYGLPSQLLHHPVTVVTVSQDYPLLEGQVITYTCPRGFVQTGPNASVCTGNGEWEPDPGEAYCIADCGVPLVDRNVMLNYCNSSTLEGAILTLTCENDIDITADKPVLNVTCHSSGSWIPNPAQFTCSSFATVPSETSSVQSGTNLIAAISSIIVYAVSSIVIFFIGYACGWFGHKRKLSRASKATSHSVEKNTCHMEQSQQPQTPGPLYEELHQESALGHQDLVELKENVAYRPIIAR